MLSDCQKAWELALANRKNVDEMIYNFADFYFEATTEINPDPGVSPEVYMTLKGPDLLFDQPATGKLVVSECSLSVFIHSLLSIG